MYNIFFIHSSVNRYLVALGYCTYHCSECWGARLFKLWFSLDRCPGAGLLDHMVVLLLVFWGTYILLSTVVLPIYIPTNSVRGLPFLHNLSSIYSLFDDVHSGWCKVVPNSSFGLLSPLMLTDIEVVSTWRPLPTLLLQTYLDISGI